MNRRHHAFKLVETIRLLKAAKAANLPIRQLTIGDDGKPVIVINDDGEADDVARLHAAVLAPEAA